MLTLVADGLATFRLAHLVIDDTLFDTPRAALLEHLDAGGPAARKAAEGLGCYWCVSVWAAAAVAVLRRWCPRVVDAFAAAALAPILAEALEHP